MKTAKKLLFEEFELRNTILKGSLLLLLQHCMWSKYHSMQSMHIFSFWGKLQHTHTHSLFVGDLVRQKKELQFLLLKSEFCYPFKDFVWKVTLILYNLHFEKKKKRKKGGPSTKMQFLLVAMIKMPATVFNCWVSQRDREKNSGKLRQICLNISNWHCLLLNTAELLIFLQKGTSYVWGLSRKKGINK